MAGPVEVAGNSVSKGLGQTGFGTAVVDPRGEDEGVFGGRHADFGGIECDGQLAPVVAGSGHFYAGNVFGIGTGIVGLTVPCGDGDVQVINGSGVGGN